MKVLSLFDGMSCGQIALNKLGYNIEEYYASEVDKYAIQTTKKNYPNTIHLGDVRNVDIKNLPKIDLLIGGSPCQSFSFAGRKKGMTTKSNIEILSLEHYLELKEQDFEFEGQSYLFWEYMRILKAVKPKYFLLENVVMSSKWENVLSKAIGIKPIKINSALVSAQNRNRLYWTNIKAEPQGLFGDLECMIEQPEDKGFILKDVLENDVDEKYFLKNFNTSYKSQSNKIHKGERFGCLAAGTHGYAMGYIINNCQSRKIIKEDFKEIVSVRKHEVNIKELQVLLKTKKNKTIKAIAEEIGVKKTKVEHWFRTDSSFSIPDKEHWFKLKQVLNIETKEFDKQITEFIQKESNFDQSNRAYNQEGLAPCLTATAADEKIIVKSNVRRLTPIECERLQTVPDNYTKGVSDTQRYKMLGNGWTVDVICHILSYIK